MAPLSAVSVDDNLAAGQPAVAHRTADDETTRGVDIVSRFHVDHFLRQNLFYNTFDDRIPQELVLNVRFVLGGNNHGVNALGYTIFVLYRDLRLAVRTQEIERTVFPDLRQSAADLVGQHNGQRHHFGCFVTSIPEHESLVTGALLLVASIAAVDALGDIERLVIDTGDDAAGLPIEAHLGRVVSDVLDRVANDLGHLHVSVGGDFSGDKRQTGGHQCFAGNAAVLVLGDDGIQYGIRYLIGDLVRVPLGHRFGGEKKLFFLFHA